MSQRSDHSFMTYAPLCSDDPILKYAPLFGDWRPVAFLGGGTNGRVYKVVRMIRLVRGKEPLK